MQGEDENLLDDPVDDDIPEEQQSNGKRATQENFNYWKILHNGGLTIREIAEKTGWTAATIQKGLKKATTVTTEPAIPESSGEMSIEEDNEQVLEPVDERMKKLNDIMQELGIGEKIRASICKSVQDVPNYNNSDGLFNLLTTGWRGIDGKKAKLICERWFGYQNQQQVNSNIRPINPGFPNQPPQYNPINPGYPQQQQFSNPQYPQYYPPQQQYPMYPPYAPNPQPQITAEQITAQIQKAVAENDKKWEERVKAEKEEKRYEEMNKKFEALQKQLEQKASAPKEGMVIRRIPILDEENHPVLNPETKEPMYSEEVMPAEKSDPYAAMAESQKETMKEFKDLILKFRTPGSISDKEIELERKAAAQEIELKMKEMEKKMELDMSKLKSSSELQEALAKIQSETTKPEMSDDARLAAQTLTEQGKLVTTAISNLHDTGRELIGLLKLAIAPDASVKMATAQQQPQTQQWTEEELTAINKEMG